ncbi:hypothetical protein ACTXIU_13340 [Glutamicibacter arilaitensis]|uniref:hypothetical protein n=1 Tax=Glutamicibacter arilaitensis TaxID=256701 RepID=UPI003FD4AB3F
MANFSAPHTQSLVLIQEASRLRTLTGRQVREGSQNQGDRELQRTASNISFALERIAEAVGHLAEQAETLAYEKTGDVSRAELKLAAEKIRLAVESLPSKPL